MLVKDKLYLVTDRRGFESEADFLKAVREALEGGVSIVQLREKKIEPKEWLYWGDKLRKLTSDYRALFIINDHYDIAKKVGADGVHLGQTDGDAGLAREFLGKEAVIGLSIETIEQAKVAMKLPIDYVAASPVFATTTKTDTAKPWGLEGLKALARISTKPIVAIGGLRSENAAAVLAAGAHSLAIISAILGHDEPRLAAEGFVEILRAKNR